MSERLSNIIPDRSRTAPGGELRVEVVADLICPFCYIGKRRLDTALDAVRGPYAVSWYPWQLNPEMPEAGLPFDEYLTQRFGERAAIQPVLDRLESEGRDEGIDFRFDRLRHVPNTLPAHQLMQFADSRGIDQSRLAEQLLSAFFEKGIDIGDTDALVAIGGRLGLDAAEIVQALEDEELRESVQTREGRVRASGIAGVPGYLLNRRLLMVGAQDSDTMINAFDHAMFGEGTDGLESPALH